MMASLCTDINPMAAIASQQTARKNNVVYDSLVSCLCDGIRSERHLFDLILFNPPYVPSEDVITPYSRDDKDLEESVSDSILDAAWAGGARGRFWIDKFISKIDGLLTENGLFYLVVIADNDPQEIMDIAKSEYQLLSTVVLARKTSLEHLSVIRFSKK